MDKNREHQLTIVHALHDGEPVQRRYITLHATAEDWEEALGEDANFIDYEYRLVPFPIECWVNIYHNNVRSYHTSPTLALDANDGTALRVAVHLKEPTTDD